MVFEESLIGTDYSIYSDNDYPLEFKKDLNYFLEKSQEEYPINIVVTGEESINIVLLKNIKNTKYNFDYENAVEDIFKFLIDLIPNYGLNDIKYNNDDYGFHPMFNITVPESVSSPSGAGSFAAIVCIGVV